MPYLTQLADVARRTAYPVTEVAGWQSRGHGPQPEVKGIVCHHTAGPPGGGDYPSLAVVRDGRPGLDGPVSQFGLGRSGHIYLIAAGRCWHNAPSTSAAHANSSSLGIEAENDGTQPWPDVQKEAYVRLCAELCREFRLPASRVKAHREANAAKPDPHSIDVNDPS
ncbi:peptidoglycan recognition family protein [Nonomuraea sp. NPDC046802]|uniref:peptidoglycan recognition protein family protein n=1 Tax=Nonomuraea sp. NPDC046802 TaxID=3154919 RepID=UPI0033D70163